VLLDVNTRPWKWISMPVAAGANLPMAAYADATGADYDPGPLTDARWVSLADYLPLVAGGELADVLASDDWQALVSGEFETTGDLTTAVYRPSDPHPSPTASTWSSAVGTTTAPAEVQVRSRDQPSP